jgi:hypothetical protein
VWTHYRDQGRATGRWSDCGWTGQGSQAPAFILGKRTPTICCKVPPCLWMTKPTVSSPRQLGQLNSRYAPNAERSSTHNFPRTACIASRVVCTRRACVRITLDKCLLFLTEPGVFTARQRLRGPRQHLGPSTQPSQPPFEASQPVGYGSHKVPFLVLFRIQRFFRCRARRPTASHLLACSRPATRAYRIAPLFNGGGRSVVRRDVSQRSKLAKARPLPGMDV